MKHNPLGLKAWLFPPVQAGGFFCAFQQPCEEKMPRLYANYPKQCRRGERFFAPLHREDRTALTGRIDKNRQGSIWINADG